MTERSKLNLEYVGASGGHAFFEATLPEEKKEARASDARFEDLMDKARKLSEDIKSKLAGP